jgi:hypothetical protein
MIRECRSYQSWCSRFAVRATFDAAGERLTTVSEWHVTRYDLAPAP